MKQSFLLPSWQRHEVRYARLKIKHHLFGRKSDCQTSRTVQCEAMVLVIRKEKFVLLHGLQALSLWLLKDPKKRSDGLPLLDSSYLPLQSDLLGLSLHDLHSRLLLAAAAAFLSSFIIFLLLLLNEKYRPPYKNQTTTKSTKDNTSIR